MLRYLQSLFQPFGLQLRLVCKFPTLVTQQEFLESKVNETKAMVKFKLKKVLCMSVAVGNCRMEGSRSSRTSK
uniref:Uncharacterized protein n=1 Tax=Quercus lobata TaxID=97700 RepID=A0A7N2KUF5_QUELO